MRALSLWQPHAAAIMLGLKTWETRGWDTSYRGPLAIHAAKKPFREQDYDWNWFCEAKKRLSMAGQPLWKLDYGKVICIVDVVDCVPTLHCRAMAAAQKVQADGKLPDWYFWGDFRERGEDGKPRYAFKLENLRKIPEAYRLEINGRQSFFDVPNEVGLWG